MLSSNVSAGTPATAAEYNNLRGDLVLGQKVIGTDADASTITIDLSDQTKGNIRKITLGGNRTIAISNPANGAFLLIIRQDATGGRTVNWFAGLIWENVTTPILTTIANRYDIFSFIYDGTNYYGSVVGQNYG